MREHRLPASPGYPASVGRDESPTVVDALPRGERTGAAADARAGDATTTAPRAPPDTITSALPKPETVLRRAEIEQARRTAIAGLVFNTLGLVAAPLFGGDPTARAICIAGLALANVNNLRLLYVASDARRFHERHVVVFFAVAPLFNAAIMYHLGVFGPILVIFVLNLYAACLGYGRRVALVTLVGSIAPAFLLGGAMASGLLSDPGITTTSAYAGPTVRWLIVLAFALFLVLVYAQARRARELMVVSLVERDEVVRRASHREALFLETRQELERAMHAGGLGRFTDQTLGSYKLGALIGRGGMGEVYEATHLKTGEAAAVKLLLPEVIGRPDYVRRFLREVRVAASIDSPHVVRVLEVGDESAPLPYLAMERLVGEDLAQILRREERLEPAAVADLVRQVARGIDAAAAAGVVHRDIKPLNLFATRGQPAAPTSPTPLWKIIDFGVSKLAESSATLTHGELIGTPQYMAPEQARGAEVDVRADLYALGAVAYRALTGHPPFKGGDLAEIARAVARAMPARPSALAPVHRDVDLALSIALAKKPDDRFQTADELSDALGAALVGKLDDAHRRRAMALLAALPWAEPR